MSMPLRAFLLTSIMCFPLAGQAQDARTIQQMNDKFSQAVAKGDFAAVANLYAEDAFCSPPGADIVTPGEPGSSRFGPVR